MEDLPEELHARIYCRENILTWILRQAVLSHGRGLRFEPVRDLSGTRDFFRGASLGGYGGAHYAQKMDPRRVRQFVIFVGFAMALYFFIRH